MLTLSICPADLPRASARAGSAQPVLRFEDDPGRPGFGTVIVTGLDPRALERLREDPPDAARWERIFPVSTGALFPSGGSRPLILGTWTLEETVIRFTPRFPIATGLTCSARFDGPLLDDLTGLEGAATPVLEIRFSMPDPVLEPSTSVTAIYPSGTTVPENLLRLYVHFSAPMREQPLEGRIRLIDEDGVEVDEAFVVVRQGLWDPDHRRLTLFFHPGRIKRGVGPHDVMGPPLRAGRSFRVVVGANLLDAHGFPLSAPFEKRYEVGTPDRTSPDPASWRVTPPAETRPDLVVDLPEPMDHALTLRLVSVVDEEDAPIRGTSTLEAGERRWSFTPAAPWKGGRYALRVDPAIEDLAGNTPSRLFDQRGSGPMRSREPSQQPPIRIPFEVTPRR